MRIAHRALAGFLGLSFLVFSQAARAEVIVYEGFDMGTTAGDLNGRAGATSHGFAAGSTWGDVAGVALYQTSGLSFADVPVTGGKAFFRATSTTIGYNDFAKAWRRLGVSATGTIYGSYLVHRPEYTSPNNNGLVSVMRRDYPQETQFSAGWKDWNVWTGTVEIGNVWNSLSGTPVPRVATHLVLFEVSGLVAEGAGNKSQSITEWILNASQYNYFKTNGLTEAELNLASLGSGSTNVLQRGTLTVTQNQHFTTNDYLGFSHTAYMSGIAAYYDELRISNASLNEAVGLQVPEPSALCLCSGLGAVGLLCTWRRQRRQGLR